MRTWFLKSKLLLNIFIMYSIVKDSFTYYDYCNIFILLVLFNMMIVEYLIIKM